MNRLWIILTGRWRVSTAAELAERLGPWPKVALAFRVNSDSESQLKFQFVSFANFRLTAQSRGLAAIQTGGWAQLSARSRSCAGYITEQISG